MLNSLRNSDLVAFVIAYAIVKPEEFKYRKKRENKSEE